MPKSRNTYNKGMNQDASRSKYDPANYYNALNLRIVTHDGLSTGSIENEKGNALAFSIPDIPREIITHNDGTTSDIPAQSNLKIIGWCSVDKYLVVFTTAGIAEGGGSPGQVWRFQYNEDTNSINVPTPGGSALNVSDHLIYNGFLNFSSYHRIEAEGRFENNNKIKVYWTDFNNQLRTIDILNTNTRNLKPDVLDINPDVNFTMPSPVLVSSGGLPASAKVQYGYRLISAEGSQTVVSPVSALVSLIPSDTNSEVNYVDVEGISPDTSNSKAVTFKVTGIDQDYSIIEHIAVLYTVKDAPQIFKFGEDSVPSSGELEIVLDGSETRIDLTKAEFSLVSAGFDKCKTIDSKDNILIAGNIVSEPAEISTETWDSRAYRFNSSRNAFLDDQNTPLTLNGVNPLWGDVPYDHDAINPFNTEREDNNWITASQYKFKSDGTTIGGEGPNVSYEFVDYTLEGDDAVNGASQLRRSPPHVSAGRFGTNNLDLGIKNSDGSAVTHPLTGQFKNFSSPLVESFLTGHSRGEVYRFGIEFYKKKGNVTFVKWIADIKFPEPKDGFPIANGPLDSGTLDLKTLGIRFTVDVSAIANDVSAYRIVRAERGNDNATRLGTGTIMLINREIASSNKTALYEALNPSFNSSDIEVGNEELEWDKNIASNGGKARFHLPDAPGMDRVNAGGVRGVHDEYPSTKQNTIFLSPLTIFKKELGFEFKPLDYIKTLGYYQCRAQQYVNVTSAANNGNLNRQGWTWINRTFQNSAHGDESFEIENIKYLDNAVRLTGSALPDSISSGGDDFLNTTYGKVNGTNQKKYPFGIGNLIHYMVLKNNSLSLPGFQAASAMDWNNNVREGSFQYSTNGANLTTTDDWSFKEVSYVRPLEQQYGGNSFEARSKTSYVSTGHFQPVTSSVPNTLSFDVYGGDTTVSYFDREYIQPYLNQSFQDEDSHLEANDELWMSIAVLMPVESRINYEYAWGNHFAKSKDGENMGAYLNDRYTHAELFTQQANSEGKFFSKDFATTLTNEYPHRLWASEKKIDGELIDSWRKFKSANILDVEGSYGPINKVVNFQDKLIYYQDKAFGIASVNERSMVTDTQGVEITLGTGDILDDFRYLSTSTGSFHQHSIVPSANAVYHYDVNLRKMYRYGGAGIQPLSDIKGLSSFFANNVDNAIVDTDVTLRDASLGGSIGVHGTFDFRHNRAIYTFLNPKNNLNNFTVGYNEALDGFESFYSYTPDMYLNTGRRMFSKDSSGSNQGYIHDEGIYGEFYGNISNTEITLMISPQADLPKIFSNIEYNSEVSLSGIQQPLETFNQLEVFNDYQSTGVIPLIVPTNIKRRMRHWRHAIGRDSLSSNQRARIRDYSIFLKLVYNNNNNKRLVLHDMIISYTPSRD